MRVAGIKGHGGCPPGLAVRTWLEKADSSATEELILRCNYSVIGGTLYSYGVS